MEGAGRRGRGRLVGVGREWVELSGMKESEVVRELRGEEVRERGR